MIYAAHASPLAANFPISSAVLACAAPFYGICSFVKTIFGGKKDQILQMPPLYDPVQHGRQLRPIRPPTMQVFLVGRIFLGYPAVRLVWRYRAVVPAA
jgi:hypothetical protein